MTAPVDHTFARLHFGCAARRHLRYAIQRSSDYHTCTFSIYVGCDTRLVLTVFEHAVCSVRFFAFVAFATRIGLLPDTHLTHRGILRYQTFCYVFVNALPFSFFFCQHRLCVFAFRFSCRFGSAFAVATTFWTFAAPLPDVSRV